MVDFIQILVPAALHFAQERPSSPGVAGVHIRVEVAAQTADYLGLVEDALNGYTGEREQRTGHHKLYLFNSRGIEALRAPTHGIPVIPSGWSGL